MSAGPSFDISTHYEMYLPTEGTLVDVVATVRSTGTAAGDGRSGSVAPHLAEVILLDCSGSMGSPTSKLIQARRAAARRSTRCRTGSGSPWWRAPTPRR